MTGGGRAGVILSEPLQGESPEERVTRARISKNAWDVAKKGSYDAQYEGNGIFA